MIEKRTRRFCAAFGLAAALLLAGEAQLAQVTYQIAANTSGLKTTPG